jgi:hypothetical protein
MKKILLFIFIQFAMMLNVSGKDFITVWSTVGMQYDASAVSARKDLIVKGWTIIGDSQSTTPCAKN